MIGLSRRIDFNLVALPGVQWVHSNRTEHSVTKTAPHQKNDLPLLFPVSGCGNQWHKQSTMCELGTFRRDMILW